MLITASPEISGVSSKYTGSWSVTGVGCCAAAAGPDAASPGTPSTKSKNGHRYCHLHCASPTGSCRRLQCCEATAEERWCGKSARHVLWEPGAGDRLRGPGGGGNGGTAEPVGHRQTKGAATDMFDLQPPRHISTLRSAGILARRCEGLKCADTLSIIGARSNRGVRPRSRLTRAANVARYSL